MPEDSQGVPDLLLKRPFRYYLGHYRKNFLRGITALLLTNFFDVLPPIILAYGIDQVQDGKAPSEILKTTGMLFAVLILTAVFRYMWRIFFGQFHHTVADDLRRRVFQHYTKLDSAFFSKATVGELMSLITNDISMFRMGIGPGVLILFDAFFYTCFTIPIMISIQPQWTWKTLIFLPFVPFLIRRVMKFLYTRFKDQQDAFSQLSGIAQEIISGIRVVKGFAQEPIQTEKFNRKSKQYEDACNATARVDSMFEPVMEFGIASGSVILLWVGSSDVIQGTVSLGQFFAFHLYIMRMVWPMTAVGLGFSHVQKGLASFQRIRELLESKPLVPNIGTQEISDFETLKVSNLTFKYPGESIQALTDVSFELRKGQTLGIVGAVGSGKSTLLKLLTRQYPSIAGQIKINDINVEKYELDSLRSCFRMIPQDPFLFSETVAQNIGFAMDPTPELQRLEDVAKSVQIHEEVLAIPGNYNAQLGERGVNLSGGQKQRMTIARGLITESPVLLLDDSLSAVDASTEESIQNSLIHSQNRGQTRIIISHRLSSIQKADQILVFNQGRIEATGTHNQLLKSSPTYLNLATIQGLVETEGTL